MWGPLSQQGELARASPPTLIGGEGAIIVPANAVGQIPKKDRVVRWALPARSFCVLFPTRLPRVRLQRLEAGERRQRPPPPVDVAANKEEVVGVRGHVLLYHLETL